MDQVLLTTLPGFPVQIIDDASVDGAATIARYIASGGSVSPATPELRVVLDTLGRGSGAGTGVSNVVSAAVVAQLAKAGGAPRAAVSWKPNGGGDARMFPDVMGLIERAATPLDVFVFDGPKDVPAGTYDMRQARFVSDGLAMDHGAINALDGAVMRNLRGLSSTRIESLSSSHVLEFEYGGGAPAIFEFAFGGLLYSAGTGPMIDVAAGEVLIAACINGGDLVSTLGPVVALAAGGIFVAACLGAPPFFSGNWVTGVPGSFLAFLQDGLDDTARAVPGGFGGTVINSAFLNDGGAGPSALRPGGLFSALMVGTRYFDTDLVPPRPIWWDGAQWVDAAGVPV